MGNLLNLTDSREIDVLCREHHRCITRVNTGILYVLRDGVLNHLTLVGYGVELYLLGLSHELRHHHGEFLGYLCSHIQEAMQFFLVIAYVHRSTREYI